MNAPVDDAAVSRDAVGLPPGIKACLFDLDGVLTQTARLHAAAWKEMFDAFLRQRTEEAGEAFVPFDPVADYNEYIDGKLRYDGVRSFLASRRIALPEGESNDPPTAETVHGLGDRKDQLMLALIRERGVDVYEGSVRYVRAVRDAGLRRAVVSASTHTRDVLEAADIADLFEVRIDGLVAAEEHLPGKPAPDTFLAAARALELDPREAAVFEDSLAGVAAGRAGGFGFVVGVDRHQRGLAGPVRTEVAERDATGYAELHVADDRPLAEALRQAVGLDDVLWKWGECVHVVIRSCAARSRLGRKDRSSPPPGPTSPPSFG